MGIVIPIIPLNSINSEEYIEETIETDGHHTVKHVTMGDGF